MTPERIAELCKSVRDAGGGRGGGAPGLGLHPDLLAETLDALEAERVKTKRLSEVLRTAPNRHTPECTDWRTEFGKCTCGTDIWLGMVEAALAETAAT